MFETYLNLDDKYYDKFETPFHGQPSMTPSSISGRCEGSWIKRGFVFS